MDQILQFRCDSDSNNVFQDDLKSFSKPVSILDILYGQISLPQYCWMFVDSPAMQRLKYLNQLGPNYLVFPGATH